MKIKRVVALLKIAIKTTIDQTIIVLLFICATYAKDSLAQEIFDKKITLSLNNVEIRDVLNQIQKQTDVKFVYSTTAIKGKRKTSAYYSNMKLGELLDQFLKPLNISFKISDNKILLFVQTADNKDGSGTKLKGEINTDAKSKLLPAEGQRVSGKVLDESTNKEIPGVNVVVKGTTIGTQTDMNGNYSIVVPDNQSILVFSYLGFTTKEVPVGASTILDMTLSPDIRSLEEVVVVAFGKQKKMSMVSATETIDPKELKVPSSNLTTALAGRLAGVIAYQRSGEPGQENIDFFIRGVTTFGYKVDPLIYIDGVESSKLDLARMQPDDIASFSIMKDATASALYGSRGANGVILVTTKVGKEGPVKINVRYETSMSSNTKDVELADPVTYMKLRNEAVLTRNPLGELPYSQTKISNTVAGLNKYAYPVTDWRDELIKKSTWNQRLNLNASGGGNIARYYIGGTYNIDNGILKVDERNNFNSNIKLKSYQLRSNVSVNMTKTTEVTVRLSGNFDDYNGPIDGGTGLYRKIMRTDPVSFPAYFPASDLPFAKHILFGNTSDGLGFNPYADMVKGYKEYNRSLMNAQLEVKQNLNFLVDGLNARVMFNTSRYGYYEISRYYDPYFYSAINYNKNTDTYLINSLNKGTEYLGYNEGLKDLFATTYLESTLSYNKAFGKHEVTGLLVYYLRNQVNANQGNLLLSLPNRNVGSSGRFSYSYDTRYMAEFTFGYNGSERFYKDKRYGFFPAMGLGWFVSHEKFWEPFKDVVSELKLRGTYGLVGNDAIGSASDRFFYLSQVNMNDGNRGSRFGESFGDYKNGISISRYSNTDITWEIAKKLDIGFDLGLFRDLQIQGDYFREYRSNILMTRVDLPTTMGLSADVRANSGEAMSKGFDLSATLNKNIRKDFWIQARGNFTYAHSEFTKYDQPEYDEAYLDRVGNPIRQVYGYIAERLFVDDEEVANSPKQNFGDVMGGDIKFRDVNGDGQVTDLDKVPIGYPEVPEIIYGFGISAGFKGFDFSCFFQGSARSSLWIDPYYTAPFISTYYSGEAQTYRSQNQLLKAYADDHWSEENRNLYATWPRLSNDYVGNNAQWSTWFMRNGAFLRLKNAEIGYTIPKSISTKAHMQSARVYVNGTNLLLISGFKIWDVEMGGNGLGYPIQKVVNIGVHVGF